MLKFSWVWHLQHIPGSGLGVAPEAYRYLEVGVGVASFRSLYLDVGLVWHQEPVPGSGVGVAPVEGFALPPVAGVEAGLEVSGGAHHWRAVVTI